MNRQLKQNRRLESKLYRVHGKSEALRTTLPAEIRNILGLKAGYRLVWIFDPCKGKVSVEFQSSTGNKGEGA